MKNKTLKIPQKVAEEIRKYAQEGYPFEICGLLSGNGLSVKNFWIMQTKFKHRYKFFVEEKVVEETLNQIKDKGEEVLVIFHSHPTQKAIPSTTDVLNHPDPDVLMMIISLKEENINIGCFQIKEGRYHPFEYTII